MNAIPHSTAARPTRDVDFIPPDPSQGEALVVISVARPLDGVDLPAFLRQAAGQARFAWSTPATGAIGEQIGGTGVAAELVVLPSLDADSRPGHSSRYADIEAQAERLFASTQQWVIGANGSLERIEDPTHPARSRLFGGFSFRADFTPDNTWACFQPAHFVLPHYQLTIRPDQTWLTLNALVPANDLAGPSAESVVVDLAEALLARVRLLAATTPTTGPHQATTPRSARAGLSYPMTAETWRDMVATATGSIHAGEMAKVVLARVCEARLPDVIDAIDVLSALDTRYGDCFRFLFEAQANHAFLGASPELLIRRTGWDIETMALAGSAPRSQNPEEDAGNGAELLASIKDNHEHRLVSDMIIDRLSQLAGHLDLPEQPQLLTLRNIHHLLTPITGKLSAEHPANILELVRALHPTPALGGVPVNRALAFIRDHEPVPRGWYAAPVGWFDRAFNGEFAVAIRSAVTQHDRAWLYAGAGIVADSEPDREWAETALKFRPMLEAFGFSAEGRR